MNPLALLKHALLLATLSSLLVLAGCISEEQPKATPPTPTQPPISVFPPQPVAPPQTVPPVAPPEPPTPPPEPPAPPVEKIEAGHVAGVLEDFGVPEGLAALPVDCTTLHGIDSTPSLPSDDVPRVNQSAYNSSSCLQRDPVVSANAREFLSVSSGPHIATGRIDFASACAPFTTKKSGGFTFKKGSFFTGGPLTVNGEKASSVSLKVLGDVLVSGEKVSMTDSGTAGKVEAVYRNAVLDFNKGVALFYAGEEFIELSASSLTLTGKTQAQFTSSATGEVKTLELDEVTLSPAGAGGALLKSRLIVFPQKETLVSKTFGESYFTGTIQTHDEYYSQGVFFARGGFTLTGQEYRAGIYSFERTSGEPQFKSAAKTSNIQTACYEAQKNTTFYIQINVRETNNNVASGLRAALLLDKALGEPEVFVVEGVEKPCAGTECGQASETLAKDRSEEKT